MKSSARKNRRRIMKIETKFYGEIEIAPENIYSFQDGIPAFEQEKEFALLPMDETPFMILQSTQNPQLALVMMNPWTIDKDYAFDLTPHAIEKLQVEQPNELNIYCIVTLNQSLADMTINLVSPVIFNQNKKCAAQIILENTAYTTRHSLVMEGERIARY